MRAACMKMSVIFPIQPCSKKAEFLTVMRGRWNISLFQYRQHGGSYANVLVGLQSIPGTENRIDDFLEALGYPYVRETDNPAYKMFLGA